MIPGGRVHSTTSRPALRILLGFCSMCRAQWRGLEFVTNSSGRPIFCTVRIFVLMKTACGVALLCWPI